MSGYEINLSRGETHPYTRTIKAMDTKANRTTERIVKAMSKLFM